MNDDQKLAYIALIDAAHEELHARQREAFAAFEKDRDHTRRDRALMDANDTYKRQIGLR